MTGRLLRVAWTALFVFETLRYRRRAGALAVLAPPATAPEADEYVFLSAPEVALSDTTRAAAAAYMAANGLEALDLVPADLDAESALALLAALDPAVFRADPLAPAAGAGHAVVAKHGLLARAGVTDPPMDAAGVVSLLRRLKRFAATTTGVVVAPELTARRPAPAEAAAESRARLGAAAGAHTYLQGLGLAWLTVLLRSPRAGLAALLLLDLQPWIALAGSPLRPTAPAGRLWTRARRWWCMLSGGPDPAVESRRAAYGVWPAAGTALFEPRADRCPLCGSRRLEPRLRTTDLLQGKPGAFSLERCRGCGHVFQNPRLSPVGLDYYYRDFYDGLWGDVADELFATLGKLYRQRAAALPAGAAPARWLDVGSAYGHFALVARAILPGTRFEGLDRSPAVEEGVRRGWLDRAWLGTLDRLAPGLRGQFDAVSAFHYLEHTTDPAAELRAMAAVLRPSGWLMIEGPNQACRRARWLGRWWQPWFQPQHLHFLRAEAVESLLAEVGLRVERVEYLNTAGDWLLGALLFLRAAAGPGDVPWRPRRSGADRARGWAIWAAGLPLLAAAIAADAAEGALPPSPSNSNAYRVLARLA